MLGVGALDSAHAGTDRLWVDSTLNVSNGSCWILLNSGVPIVAGDGDKSF